MTGFLYETALVVVIIGGFIALALMSSDRPLTGPSRESLAVSSPGSGSDQHDRSSVHRLCLVRNGGGVLICDQLLGISLWDCDAGSVAAVRPPDLRHVNIAAGTEDGRTLLFGDAYGKMVIRDTTENGADRHLAPSHQSHVTSIAVRGDGGVAASADGTGLIRLWELPSGRVLGELTGHTTLVQRVRFSTDGRQLLSAGGDGTVRLWDLEEMSQFGCLRGHENSVMDVDFLEAGRSVVSVSLDGTLRTWEIEAEREIARSPVHPLGLFSVAVAPDRQVVACGGINGMIKLWNPDERAFTTELAAHERCVRCLEYTRDGRMLVSGGFDGMVCRWDAATMTVIDRLR